MQDAYVTQRTIEPEACSVVEFGQEPGPRSLLMFPAVMVNVGEGDLIIGGVEDHPEWFTYSECHDHYHFREYADYRLWTSEVHGDWISLRASNPDKLSSELLAENPDVAAGMVAGRKLGFCVVDLIPYREHQHDTTPFYDHCLENQGLSVGWADAYFIGIDGQWIDVTGLEPGTYFLEIEVNAERFFEESDYSNNLTSVPVKL
jgi:hypothetical protein